MAYEPKKQPCPLCKGSKVVTGGKAVLVLGEPKETSPETQEIVDAMVNDMSCPNCNGAGDISVPPYNNGSKAQMSKELVSKLASAGTLMLCIDQPFYVQAVANQAARVKLSEEVAATYAAYWADPDRDVTLGEYIMQIAQSAEEHALAVYGDLGNPICAQPRPASK